MDHGPLLKPIKLFAKELIFLNNLSKVETWQQDFKNLMCNAQFTTIHFVILAYRNNK